MNLDQMMVRCPGSRFMGTALLENWCYYINGNGYAGIEKSYGSTVYGCLWDLDKRHWEALDQYEAVAEGYYEKAKIEVKLLPTLSMTWVWVYLSKNKAYGIPSSSYQKIILQGARQVGLPMHHIQSLEAWLKEKKP